MPVLPVVVTITAAHRLARTPEALVTPDALPYLPSAAAWHALRGRWGPFLTAHWASRYWHAYRNRKDGR